MLLLLEPRSSAPSPSGLPAHTRQHEVRHTALHGKRELHQDELSHPLLPFLKTVQGSSVSVVTRQGAATSRAGEAAAEGVTHTSVCKGGLERLDSIAK